MAWLEKLHAWSGAKLRERLADRWGMIRTCPWCRQCVEHGGKHQMREAEHCIMFDTFTCGVCGGESHWEFGPTPMIRGIGKGPVAAQWALDADKETRRILKATRP